MSMVTVALTGGDGDYARSRKTLEIWHPSPRESSGCSTCGTARFSTGAIHSPMGRNHRNGSTPTGAGQTVVGARRRALREGLCMVVDLPGARYPE